MLAKRFLAVAVFSFCGATAAMADGRHHGRGNGHAYGHYRNAGPAVVSARVVDVEPLVRYVTVNRPRQECWDEIVREPVRRFGVAGPTAAGSVDAAIKGFKVNKAKLEDALERNPILVTALNPVIGYEKGAAIAKQAYKEGRAIRDVAAAQTELKPEQLRELLDPLELTKGGIKG